MNILAFLLTCLLKGCCFNAPWLLQIFPGMSNTSPPPHTVVYPIGLYITIGHPNIWEEPSMQLGNRYSILLTGRMLAVPGSSKVARNGLPKKVLTISIAGMLFNTSDPMLLVCKEGFYKGQLIIRCWR